MDRVKKWLKQIEIRTIVIIVMVWGLLAGLMLPKAPEIPVELTQSVVSANQTIGELQEKVASMNTYDINVEQRVKALEASGLGSFQQELNQVKLDMQNMKDNYQQRFAALEQGGSSGFAVETLRLNLESEIAQLKARATILEFALLVPTSENITVETDEVTAISYDFDINCNWYPVYGDEQYGQQFKNTVSLRVTAIRLYLKRGAGSPEAFKVSLYSVNANKLPMDLLWSKTMDASSWSVDGSWHRISVSTLLVMAPETNYAITFSHKEGDVNNYVSWGYSITGGYADGAILQSLDSGTVWTVSPVPDIGFEILGVVQ